jgi:hypothetical protein
MWKFFKYLWDRPTTYGKIDPALLQDMVDDFNEDVTEARKHPATRCYYDRCYYERCACAHLMDRYASAWLEARYRASVHGFDPEWPISALTFEVLGHDDANDHKVWGSFHQPIRDAIDEMEPFTRFHTFGSPRFPEWKEWAVKNQTLPLPLVKLMAPILVGIDLETAAWAGQRDKATQSLKPYINQWVDLN